MFKKRSTALIFYLFTNKYCKLDPSPSYDFFLTHLNLAQLKNRFLVEIVLSVFRKCNIQFNIRFSRYKFKIYRLPRQHSYLEFGPQLFR